jgi:FdhD/NarQ family
MTRDERATEAPRLAAVTASFLRLPAGISEPDRLAVEPLEISAVELAEDRGITLCGFVRGCNANVYTEPWRLET